MKVGVWLNENIDSKVGGGFSYTDKIVSLIDERNFSKELEVVFITRSRLKSNYKKDVLVLKSRLELKTSFYHKLVIKISKKLKILKSLAKKIKNNKAQTINDHEVLELQNNGIDVIYYLTQTQQTVKNYPFISTNWDVGHISMYAFPEVNNLKSFTKRDHWYRIGIKRALLIFAESQAGKKELVKYLNINPDRIKIVPMFPGRVTSLNVSNDEQNDILKKHNLTKNEYFFYPAQFWPHKNHYNLIKAFKKFSVANPNVKLAFTGSDKGNLSYILNLIEKEQLTGKVMYSGFVELSEIHTFYKNALALVMPSFLGPTNMPLVEARDLGCPVLCSDFDGHKEQLGDGALYFNPLNENEIYESLCEIIDKDARQSLLNKAISAQRDSIFNEDISMNLLEDNLIQMSHFKNCWN